MLYDAHAGESVPSPGDEERVRAVHERVLTWYASFGRDLPWRHTRDPYAILVSEIMLQQTGVERVLPKYREFLQRFPDLASLASAPTGAVIRAWAGLGYNMRAVRLQAVARQVVAERSGILPSTVEELLALGGIGRYTAGAVACFAFGRDVAFLDTNIRRVLGRVFRGPEDQVSPLGQAAAQRLAEGVFPRGHAYAWHQALMDMGATICTVRAPLCLPCPIGDACLARFRVADPVRERTPRVVREEGPGWEAAPAKDATGRGGKGAAKEQPFVGSTRYYRGRIIAALRAVPPGDDLPLLDLGRRIKPEFDESDLAWLSDMVRRLAEDGLLEIGAEDLADPVAWRVALPA